MRLRRVAVSGFKTFARRSEVTLEPGITAIVGPNGSGKSNLVDAIRWALGETNARELRGARMDEVIYAGGAGRPRMGFAEVELILDNEEGRLPVDDVEVAVSRRVVRHGDSEFRLNGDRVRLRDVERVLGTTGLTQSGYAVVAQNDIDAIIEATPAQRRALVEQAAGVRSLRAACEEALGRVRQAEATLQRFEDLLGDAEPRLAELAVQAEAALEQRRLTEQLASLRGSLAREAWRAARAQHRLALRRLDQARLRLEAAATAEAAFAARLAGHRSHLEAERSRQADASRRLEDARVEAARAAGDRRGSADRTRAGVLARAAAAAELRVAAAEAAAAAGALARLEAEGATGPDLDAVERDRSARRDALEAARRAEALARAAVAEAAAVLRRAEDERLEAESTLRRNAARTTLVAEATEDLRRRVRSAEQGVATAAAEVQRSEAAVAECAEALGEAEARHGESANATAAARDRLAAADAALTAARDGARAALARASAARGQVEGALGGRGAIAEAVAAGDLSARRLVDCFRVRDDADEQGVAAALEPHLGAWVVTDVDAAAALVDPGTAREEILRAGEQPPERPRGSEEARWAFDAIVAEPGAAAPLAHCLRDTWLVDDPAIARAVADRGGRAVLGDGTVVDRAGVRAGGRPGRALELAARDRAAAATADTAIEAERAAEAERHEASIALATAERAARAADEALQAARLAAVSAGAGATSAAALLAAERRQLDAAEAELQARAAEHGSLAGAEAADAARLAAAAESAAHARTVAAAAEQELDTARAATSTAQRALDSVEADATRAAAQASAARERLDLARRAVAAAAARREGIARQVLAAELGLLTSLAAGHAARETERRCEAAVAAALTALDERAPGLAAAERAVTALEAERSEVAVVLARAEDEEAAASREVDAAAARVAELADAVRGDEEDDGPEPEAGAAEKAEREIVRLERRITALGPVNALAPEQHERLEVRVSRLRSGRDDLGGACADIHALARRLTAAIDTRFEAVFGAVSVHFHELFAELFPGGRATLRREAGDETATGDDGRPPQAGVEILAQPPGKRLQPLSLLSGGERALTALAVILALQQVNPSPFYVFDEVDAPLDDSNVLRFTRLLTRLSATQQFVVVTHNHITMAAADALHGVTSDGDGVSSIISVRFDAATGETVPEGHVVGLRQSTIRAAV